MCRIKLLKVIFSHFIQLNLLFHFQIAGLPVAKKKERRKAFPFSLQFALQNIICFIRATVLVGILLNFNSNQCLDKEDPKCLSFLT